MTVHTDISIHGVTADDFHVSTMGSLGLPGTRVFPLGAVSDVDAALDELVAIGERLISEARRVQRARTDDRFAAEMQAAADRTEVAS